MKIKTLLTRPAITTGPATSIRDARALMRRRGIRHLPVLEHGRLVGMLAERDIDRADASSVPEIALHDWLGPLADLLVADVMARGPLALHPETPVAEAARLACDRGVDALVVVDSDEVAGVVTRGDLLGVLGGLLEQGDPAGLGHVLAATSLRPGARRALGEALRIAGAAGAAVTALHVLPAASRVPALEGATGQDVVRVERAGAAWPTRRPPPRPVGRRTCAARWRRARWRARSPGAPRSSTRTSSWSARRPGAACSVASSRRSPTGW